MKRNLFLYIVASICIFLCICLTVSCDKIDRSPHEPEGSTIDGSNTADEGKGIPTLKVMIPTSTALSSKFNETSNQFDLLETSDPSAAESISYQILGVDYNFVYSHSEFLQYTSHYVHIYTEEGGGLLAPQLIIDAKTGGLINLSKIPCNILLSEEGDHIEIINELIGYTVDLSQYSYTCTTRYYENSEEGRLSQNASEFYVCGENEDFGFYEFLYYTSIDGVATFDQIKLQVGNYLSFTAYNYDYNERDFKNLIELLDDCDNAVTKYIEDNIISDLPITNISILSKNLFLNDGAPYVAALAVLTFQDDEIEYNSVIETIIGVSYDTSSVTTTDIASTVND